MARWKRDIIYGIVFLVFCIINFIYAGTIEQSAIEATLAKPDVYLRLWIIILGFLSVLLIVNAWRKRDEEVLPAIFQKITIFTMVCFAVYLLVLPYLGFRISTILFLGALFVFYGWNEGNKKTGKELLRQIVIWLILAVIIALLTELLFRNVLYVRLPRFNLM